MPEEMTQEVFQKTVAERIERDGISFVLAVYQVLDECWQQEINTSGIVLACRKGCSSCCHQLICCTEIEFVEIVRFIKRMPKTLRRPLEIRLKKNALKWQVYYQRNQQALQQNCFAPIKDWKGEPCPFLSEKGSCAIYPVRIIDCRTATSLTPCSSDSSGVKRFRFDFETWANNMILDQQGKTKTMNVTPVHHWLVVKLFGGKIG